MLMAFEVTESNVMGVKFLHIHVYLCVKQLLKSFGLQIIQDVVFFLKKTLFLKILE